MPDGMGNCVQGLANPSQLDSKLALVETNKKTKQKPKRKRKHKPKHSEMKSDDMTR